MIDGRSSTDKRRVAHESIILGERELHSELDSLNLVEKKRAKRVWPIIELSEFVRMCRLLAFARAY